ncbi:MAG: helix-turn-helix domain-containing protein [Acutalibacteraceae bacterium]
MLNLKYIERYRENNRIEAKRALGGFPHSVWETYSAFANTLGGVILLGVAEQKDRSFKCVRLPSPEYLAEEFKRTVNDKKQVSANILHDDSIKIIENDGLRIVAVEVPRADRHIRPVFVYGDFTHGAYRRGGEGDYRCTPEQIKSMLADRADSADSVVMENIGIDALDRGTLLRYRSKLSGGFADNSLSDIRLLQMIGAISEGADGVLHPTLAGLLMFGKSEYIASSLKNFRLTYALNGTNRISYRHNLFDSFFKMYDLLCEQFGGKGLDDLLCEGLINSIIHADYRGGAEISVYAGKSGLAISNAGNVRVSYDSFGVRNKSDIRNPSLAHMFALISLAHNTGHGSELIAANGAKLKEFFNPDKTVLSISWAENRHSKALHECIRSDLIDYITKNTSCSVYELAVVFNLSIASATAYLDELVAENIADIDKSTGKYMLKVFE